jgi:hypothetical protein
MFQLNVIDHISPQPASALVAEDQAGVHPKPDKLEVRELRKTRFSRPILRGWMLDVERSIFAPLHSAFRAPHRNALDPIPLLAIVADVSGPNNQLSITHAALRKQSPASG